MRVAVLGPLLVSDDALGLGPRDRVVLGVLVLRIGVVVRTDTLVDALWGERPPASAEKVVQGCIVRLRRMLGTEAIETVSAAGYRLRLHHDDVDATVFDSLVSRARELLAGGQPDRARYTSECALALWRGDPLPDLENWQGAQAWRGHLVDQHRDAQELACEAALAVGHHAEVLADLRGLVSEEPHREQRWAMLALAEYRCGRQAEALATIRLARRHLGETLGLDPGVELVELEAAMLRQAPGLTAPTRPPAAAECPYPGLLPFDVGDAGSFFGREAEVAAALRTLDRTHALVVVGPSGSGKSSLLRAGVAAALRRDRRRVHVMTPGRRPRVAFAATRAVPGDVIVVDQLEEALEPDVEEGAGFADDLARFVHGGGELVLGVRGDRVGTLATHPGLARLAETGLHLLGPLTADDLRRAVMGPAEQAGLVVEPGLVDLLVREVEGEPAALPLLSHVLRETWAVREGRTLTVAGYASTGGVRAAVARTAETLFHDLGPDDQLLLRQLMTRLVGTGEDSAPVRRRVPRHTIEQGQHRHALLERLIASRLLSSDGEVVEIAHESLTVVWPRLRSWLDDDVDGLRTMRHLAVSAESWDQLGRPPSELYRGVRQSRASEWRARADPAPDLTPTETAFLEASACLAAREQQAAQDQMNRERRVNRRLRAGLVVTVLLAIVATSAGVLASLASRRADAAATASDARRLGAEALRSDQLDTALLLSVAGVRLDPSSDTSANLLATLDRAPTLVRLSRTPRIVSQALNTRSGLVLAQAPDEGLLVRRASSLEAVAVHPELRGAAVVVAADGATAAVTPMPELVAAGAVPAVVLLDADGSRAETQLGGIPRGRHAQQNISVSTDSRWLAVTLLALDGDQPVTGVWDLKAPEQPVALVNLGDQSEGPVVAPGGRSLWSSGSGVLRKSALPSGRTVRTLTGRDLNLGEVDGPFALSPDGATLVLASGSQLVVVDAAGGTVRHVVPVIGRVDRIGFSADGTRVASSGDTLMVWDIAGEEPVELLAQDDGGGWPAFDAAGETLYTSAFEGMLLAWDVSGRRGFLPSVGAESVLGGGGIVIFSPDGARVLTVAGGREATFAVRDVATGADSRAVTVTQDTANYLDAAWSPDASLITVQTADDVVTVWDGTTLNEVAQHPLPAGEQAVYAAFTGDGALLVGTSQGRLHVLDARTLRPRRDPIDTAPAVGEEPPGVVSGLQVRPGTMQVLASIQDVGEVLVDTALGTVRPLDLGVDALGAAWSPDGDRLAVTRADGAVGLFDAEAARWIAPPSGRYPFAGAAPAFAPDGSEWAVAAAGRVGRWDGRTGAFLGAVTVDAGAAVSYLPDGSVLLVAQDFGPVRRWNLDPGSWVRAACAVAGRELTDVEWHDHLPGRDVQQVCAAENG